MEKVMRSIIIALTLIITTSAFSFERGQYGGSHGEGPGYDHAASTAHGDRSSGAQPTSQPPPDNGITDADYEAAYDDPSVDPEIDGNYPHTSVDSCANGCEIPQGLEDVEQP
jgi:hypothetical protein